MNRSHVFPLCGGVLLILVLSVILSGCTQPSSPAPAATPVPTSTPVPPQPAAATTVTATLPYGVTISVPGDWKRVDTLSKGTTDYGRNAVSIATCTSPPEIAGDSSSANTLDVDIDQNVPDKFDAYFNNATIAVRNTYGNPNLVQAHSITLKVGGYDTYELDWQSGDAKGSYFFTDVNGSIYIFAFKGPSQAPAVQALQGEITDIYKSITITPT